MDPALPSRNHHRLNASVATPRSWWRVVSLFALCAFLGSGGAWGYLVFLKDGTQLTTKEAYQVEGSLAIMVLQSGVTTSLPLDEIDVERTQTENARSQLGSAKVIDGVGKEENVLPSPPEKRDTLADVIRRRDAARGEPLPEPRAAVVEEAAETDEVGTRSRLTIPRTAAGYADLANLRRELLEATEVAAAIGAYLRGQGIEEVSVYRGTSEKQPLVELITPSEPQVFKALRESAGALIQLREQYPDQVEGFELLLLSDTNGSRSSRAGQFQLTPELADLLISGAITPPEFFLRYVEF